MQSFESAEPMVGRIVEGRGEADHAAVNRLARLAGLLYFVLIPTTGAWYGLTRELVAGDPTTTLAHLVAARARVEIAVIAGAFGFVDYVILGVVFYRLLRPSGPTAAGVLLAFVITSASLSLATIARQMDALSLLDMTGMPGSAPEQTALQVTLAVRGASNLFLITDIFSGLWLIPLGWLGMRSGLLPRTLGIALISGCIFYVATFVGTVFEPEYGTTVVGRMVGVVSGVPGFIGEVGTIFWLLIRGARRGSAPAASTV